MSSTRECDRGRGSVNQDDELTCIFVDVITVDPPVPLVDAHTLVMRSGNLAVASPAFATPPPGAMLRHACPDVDQAWRGQDVAAAPSREAVTLPDAHARARAQAEDAALDASSEAAARVLRGVPLFVCGFLAAFFAAGALLLSPVGGKNAELIAHAVRHTLHLSVEDLPSRLRTAVHGSRIWGRTQATR